MKNLWMPAVAALLLIGCGGGGGNDNPPAADDPLAAVPDSASASATGLVDYLKQLVAVMQADADTREPVDAGKLVPPTPDNTEPENMR